MSEISQIEYVRQRQNSKEFLQIGRRRDHVLSNMQNVAISRCCFVTSCKQLQGNEQRIIKHVLHSRCTRSVAVEVCLIKLL